MTDEMIRATVSLVIKHDVAARGIGTDDLGYDNIIAIACRARRAIAHRLQEDVTSYRLDGLSGIGVSAVMTLQGYDVANLAAPPDVPPDVHAFLLSQTVRAFHIGWRRGARGKKGTASKQSAAPQVQ